MVRPIVPGRVSILLLALLLTVFSLPAQKMQPKKYPALLWEITGNGLKKPSYLFGTMHVSSKMVFHLSDSFYFGIKNADVVALELDPQLWQDQLFRFQNMQTNLRFYTQGFPNDYINEKSFQLEKYEDRLKAALSEEPAVINGLLYRTVQPRADFEEDTYLDLYIYQTGKRFGKQATGVENYYETEKLILEATQDMMKDKKKRNTDADGESMFETERKSQEAYRNGDLDLLDSLEKIMQSSDAFMEKFLYRRNEIQAHSIDSIVRNHSLFVGVGAAHLPGKRGLIELLRKKGYRLRPIIMQDRDATQRDDIEKVKVPVSFSDFTSEDGGVSVRIPGKLYKRLDGRTSDTWQYADMSNGAYYMVSRVKTHGLMFGHPEKMVMKKMDSLLYENIPGKIIHKTAITKNGYHGYDVTGKTRRGDIQRYNILVTPFEVLVFKMSGNGSYVDGKEADTFFNSIRLAGDGAKGRVNFSPKQGGFRANFPQQPFEDAENNGFDGATRWEYEAVDSTNGDAYLVWRKSIQNYRFLEEDSFDLGLMAESFRLSDYTDKELSHHFISFKGDPALEAVYRLKDGSFTRTRFIISGSQHFLVAVHTKDKNKTFAPFFDSFSLLPFVYSGFTNYTDTFINIRATTPVVPDIDANVRAIMEKTTSEDFLSSVPEYNSYWPRNKTALFRDDSTGEAVFVSVQTYPKYYYPKDSSSFWKDEVNEKRILEDLLIKNKKSFRFSDSVYGYQYVFTDTNTSKLLYNWIFLKDNKLFRIMSMGDSLINQGEFISRFYASVHPTDYRTGPPVFSNKLQLFFSDFYSKDSALSKKAREAIPNVYFGPPGVPMLLSAVNGLSSATRDYFNTKIKLINELGYITDSTVRKQVVEGLRNIYVKAADTSTFQHAALRALAKHKTREAYETLKALLVQDPPVFDNATDYNYFFQDLGDSLPLARTLFPDILQLSTVDDYKDNVRTLLTSLVDSNYLTANDYESYFSKLYFDAKIQLKKQQGRDEQQLQKKSAENADDNKYENAKSSDEDYNDLQDYAVLLIPFYDRNSSVPHFFDKLLKSGDASLRLNTAVLMIRNEKKPADSILQNLAADDRYRFLLYKKLKLIHKEKWFPGVYLNQLDMTRSQLASSTTGKDFFAINFVDREFIHDKSDQGYVYFFKYKVAKDDDWQMGISGLQPVAANEVSVDVDFVKCTNKKLKNGLPTLEQFDAQLKRLIFSRHKSAASFYLDNDYYASRGEDEN